MHHQSLVMHSPKFASNYFSFQSSFYHKPSYLYTLFIMPPCLWYLLNDIHFHPLQTCPSSITLSILDTIGLPFHSIKEKGICISVGFVIELHLFLYENILVCGTVHVLQCRFRKSFLYLPFSIVASIISGRAMKSIFFLISRFHHTKSSAIS